MARPKRKGVDYFPHDCISGKTLFIIEQKHGNNGYALWFKLLEFIGTKEGHFIDYNNPADREFLGAKCHLDEVSVTKILDDLAVLDAIDPELWAEKIIWSTGFLERISDVYIKRRVEIPAKPDIRSRNYGSNGVSVTESTQSKVKETKEKEIQIPKGISEPAVLPDPDKNLKTEFENINLPGAAKEAWPVLKNWIEEKKPAFIEPYVSAWNVFASFYSLPAVKKITEYRKRKFRTRIREDGFNFFEILNKCKNSDFLKTGGWFGFDWIIENESNYIKILEESYK